MERKYLVGELGSNELVERLSHAEINPFQVILQFQEETAVRNEQDKKSHS
jgi:hypothetical protein